MSEPGPMRCRRRSNPGIEAERARELARRLDEASRQHQARQARQARQRDPERRPAPGPNRSLDHGREPT